MTLVATQRYFGALPSGLRRGDERFFEDHLALELPSIWTTQLHNVVFNEAGELYDGDGVLEASFLSLRHLHRDIPRFQRRHRLAWADPVPIKGSYLWITDRMSHNYHHWICDCLPRLEAWLNANPSADLLLPRRVWERPFVKDSLGAYREVRVVAQPPGLSALVENLVLPDRASPEGFHHPMLAMKVAARMRAHFARESGGAGKRIYVSRERSRFRRLSNEEALAPVLARYGFEVVRFEELSFSGQVAIVSGAEAICGPHGAGLTNMLFMPPGRVIELRQLGGTPNCFFTLANVAGHSYRPVTCAPDKENQPVHTADIVADTSEVEHALTGN